MLCKEECKFLKDGSCNICKIKREFIKTSNVMDILSYLAYDASWDDFDYVKTMCGSEI